MVAVQKFKVNIWTTLWYLKKVRVSIVIFVVIQRGVNYFHPFNFNNIQPTSSENLLLGPCEYRRSMKALTTFDQLLSRIYRNKRKTNVKPMTFLLFSIDHRQTQLSLTNVWSSSGLNILLVDFIRFLMAMHSEDFYRKLVFFRYFTCFLWN